MNEPLSPTPLPDVNAVLEYFLARIPLLLGNHFLGMYLVGSLALGDFEPGSSDIDLIVVTDTAIDDDLFHQLQELHAQFASSSSPWAKRVEAVYVPCFALRPASPNTSRYPQIERGTQLFSAPLENGWVFQCSTLRERGIILAGPDPLPWIDPIRAQDMSAAVATIASTWIKQASDDPTWLPWLRERDAHWFVVMTLCRMLYSLETGSVASKPHAAAWAQQTLGKPWATLIEHTLAKRHETGDISPSEEAETLEFIRFTFEQNKR